MAGRVTHFINPADLAKVATLEDLLVFLRDHLDWPYDATLDDITFDETPESLELDESTPLPHTIRQLRLPANAQCPWGIFLFEFDRSSVPRSTIRRSLRALIRKKRASGNGAERARWNREDLLFICSHGSAADPAISFVHVARPRQEDAPPRLASFGWNRTSHNRTVADFSLPRLRWLEDTATPPDWRESLAQAFDKEALTKSFYTTLHDLYSGTLVPDLKRTLKDEERAKQAALLLINRLLFLYFIQRKGWFPKVAQASSLWPPSAIASRATQAGSLCYLTAKFLPHRDKPTHHSFYTDFLWPLFQALSLPRETPGRIDDVPFLNGGLFEPNASLQDADLKIANSSFIALFDQLLEPFNFTVTEDTPLDIDVAVDPEMLGKVFERLITNRHESGAYYTPRAIVSFMCREALKTHLKGSTGFQPVAFPFEETDQTQTNTGRVPLLPFRTRRNLPHWFREGATYFITFRLGDSVPAGVLRQWRAEQEEWLRVNPEPHTPAQLDEKEHLFSETREAFLNAGHGSCALKRDDVADIVEAALKHFDGDRYDLGDWVIMPNHIHLLVTPRDGNALSAILHSWKSFTANKINKLLGSTGTFWQDESYDHIVRSEAQLAHYQRYIGDNPAKAGVKGRTGFQPVAFPPDNRDHSNTGFQSAASPHDDGSNDSKNNTGRMPVLP
jgi:REP element-mobilizing transposase RayT